MKKRRKNINKKLLPALITVVIIGGLLFYIDFIKQSNAIVPIMTRTNEELYGDSIEYEETSAHTKAIDNTMMPPLPDKEPDDRVVFNTSSLKFHKVDCEWAQKCANCIVITKKEALKRGGKPCRSCI